MKAILLIAIMMMFQSSLFSQYQYDTCIDVGSQYKYTGPTQYGGYHITSEGTIRAIVVFVQYKDDIINPNSSYWPINQPPTYHKKYIDTLQNQISVSGNFSDYYKQMSFNRLKIYGDHYFVVTQHSQKYYRDTLGYGNETYGYVNREVLQTLNSQIDYSQYDNWTFGSYNHINQPDGNVDLIMMLYRTNLYPPGACGIATLGYASNLSLDGKTIKFGFPGSGITNSGGSDGLSLVSMKHEFGHLLFGSGHPTYSDYSTIQQTTGIWGIMLSNQSGSCINAYERERLGWITFNEITQNTTATIPDYLTTGVAYKIPIPGTTDESFIIENHQKLSVFDDPNYDRPGKGLFIYHVKGTYNHPNYDIEIAEGKYDWSVPYWIDNPWGQVPDSLPVFKRGRMNINGYDGRDCPSTPKALVGNQFYCAIFYIDNNGTPLHVDRYKGDPNDAFNMDYNQVFSPWSNPRSYRWNRTTGTSIGFEIIGKSIGVNGEDIFNVKFYTSNPEQAAPSKPYLDYVGRNTPGSNRVRISWYKNLEPDISCYEIWRGWSNSPTVLPTTWYLKETVTDTFYIEDEFTIGNGSNGYAHYKIKVKDTQNKYSVFSNSLSVGIGYQLPKDNLGDNFLPSDFVLKQNYPNPFNPSTSIQFALPVGEIVNLRIYNLLGQEVRLLVSGKKSAGYHDVIWDGKDNFGNSVSSGIYLYRFETSTFKKSYKMLLVK